MAVISTHSVQVLFDHALFSVLVYYHVCMYHLNLLCHLTEFHVLIPKYGVVGYADRGQPYELFNS